MLRNAVNFKNVIDLLAGVVGLAFDQLEGLAKGEVEADDMAEVVETAETAETDETVETADVDDLTEISGIGRAFAQRLNEAGIVTYEQLANMTADQVRETTRAAQWQGDPTAWISEAGELAKN